MLFLLCIFGILISALLWIISRKKVRDERNMAFKSMTNLSAAVGSLLAIIALLQCFTQVPAGHVGVVDFFGVVSDKTLPSGIQPVNPLTPHYFFLLTTFPGTISALKRNSCGSAGSIVTRTQWESGQPNVSTRVKFSNTRLVLRL